MEVEGIFSELLQNMRDSTKWASGKWVDGDRVCPMCGRNELVRFDDGRPVARYWTCQCNKIRENRNSKSLVFKDYQRMTFDSFIQERQPDSFERMYNIAKTRKVNGNIVLRGPFGVGKTHLACALTNYIQRAVGCFVVALSMADMIHRMKAGAWDALLEKVIECDIFVADDWGRHSQVSQWLIDQYYPIIDCRMKNNAPIIITTNYSNQQFIEKFGAVDVDMAGAIMERVIERATVIEMDGPSFRLEKPAREAAGPPTLEEIC